MAQTSKCSDLIRTDVGNGVQTQFTTPLPYIYKTDINVYLWENDAWVLKTDPADYTFVNEGTIEFTTAPPAPSAGVDANIKIVRLTDVDSALAVFQPGSAIRARDLNDNFDQLIFAAQESACGLDAVEIEIDGIDGLIDTIQGDIQQNADDIAALDGRVTANEGAIQENADAIEALENKPGYTLPVASPSVLGGIKVGNNLSITQDGTLSATGGGGGTSGVSSITAGAGIFVNQSTGDVVITNTGGGGGDSGLWVQDGSDYIKPIADDMGLKIIGSQDGIESTIENGTIQTKIKDGNTQQLYLGTVGSNDVFSVSYAGDVDADGTITCEQLQAIESGNSTRYVTLRGNVGQIVTRCDGGTYALNILNSSGSTVGYINGNGDAIFNGKVKGGTYELESLDPLPA